MIVSSHKHLSLAPRPNLDEYYSQSNFAKRVLQYLYSTLHYGLQYQMGSSINSDVFSDAASAPFVDLPYGTGGMQHQCLVV